ncbi:hypothetical protein [Actinoplanes sp. M2I2]|uniref:hypothetical protein n=1 Tax=Actinoplanes sp. M2I2 TaxID=1734444 RepID=UPI00202239C0|nr:hypothetical protein [Actinoplanes sp. M2I2]
MTIYETVPEFRGGPPGGDVMSADSLSRVLLSAVSGTVGGWVARTPLLGRRGQLPPDRRQFELARDAYAEAVPHDVAATVDADAIAEWIVAQYRAADYPAVLLGSPHGSAAHLAVALGAAWLPTSVPLTVTWPGGSVGDWPGAMAWGADLARSITARNPSITVRQVHDPVRGGPLCGSTVLLHLRWVTLPAAYERFLRTRVAAGGCTLLLRDLRTWPVRAVSPRHGFQVGSPVGGGSPESYSIANPAFRRILEALGAASWPEPDPDTPPRYAERSGEPSLGVDLGRLGQESHRLLYARPETLSACVADLLRDWHAEAAARRDQAAAPGDAREPAAAPGGPRGPAAPGSAPETAAAPSGPHGPAAASGGWWHSGGPTPAPRSSPERRPDPTGGVGNRAVIECGRLLDPWVVRAGGLVPYWCESAARATVESAELWLAGSERFDGVAVLPEPPGHGGDQVAGLAQWRSLGSFARTREPMDRFTASRYPMLPVATGHATRMLGGAVPGSTVPVMPLAYALDRLERSGSSLGMLFT